MRPQYSIANSAQQIDNYALGVIVESLLLSNEKQIDDIKGIIKHHGLSVQLEDFEEQIQLTTVRATTRLWTQGNFIVGFAYVDDYSNLWFEVNPNTPSLTQIEAQIIEWGITCIEVRNKKTRKVTTLDCSCLASDDHRVDLLKRNGFLLQEIRSLQYSLSLQPPILKRALPQGFSISNVKGKQEVEELVALHRAAFGTENMTIEQRLAIMDAPHYQPMLDLVAVAPTNDLAAFCICGFVDGDKGVGYTDPIGTHPKYQRMGLGKALLSTGLAKLKNLGIKTAELGTSSENIAMQNLASELGFICSSEKLWFSKTITNAFPFQAT